MYHASGFSLSPIPSNPNFRNMVFFLTIRKRNHLGDVGQAFSFF